MSFLMAMLLLFYELTAQLNGTPCHFESTCDCKTDAVTNQTEANCAYRHLTAIPGLKNTSSDLESLDLSHNVISSINNFTFVDVFNLIYLDLSFNNISFLFVHSFFGLENLVELNLRNNHLHYEIENIPSLTFCSLKSLKYLNLKNNIGIYPSGQMYPNISSLLNLEFLILDGLPDDCFMKGYDNLTKLKHLSLSSQFCYVKRMKAHFFQSTKHLNHVDISRCQIKRLETDIFKDLANLTYLDVSYNELLKFKGVATITSELNFTSIQILKFNKVHDTFDMNTELGPDVLNPLSSTNLRELYADSNRIQKIKDGSVSILPKSLDVISMADNMMSYGIYMLEARHLNITFLNVSFQFSSHVPHLKREISHTERHNDTLFTRQHLDISFPIPVPKNLREVHIRRSQLQFDITALDLQDNKIEYIDSSRNLFQRWLGPTSNFKCLNFLNLSSNFASYISNKFFVGMAQVEKLYIQDNLLGFSLPSDTNGEIFSPLLKLKVLDISQNRIPSLPFMMFAKQLHLEKLLLQDNFLEDFHFDISKMKNLSFLDLSDNRIRFLDGDAMHQFDTVATKNNGFRLSLSGNPLVCTCASLNFIKWMRKTKVELVDLKDYRCKLSNGSTIILDDINTMFENLEKNCSSYTVLVFIISSAICIFILVVIFGVAYRYRWKLRYLYYMTKNKFRGYVPIMQENKTYLYDAFISYANADSDFVHSKIINHIEKEGGLKLCLHKRDFLPGNEIAANITSAIHNSRHTVVILSPQYLDSDWCMFEFNMAKMESLYSRDSEDLVYMVFLTNIPISSLPLQMIEYIHSHSYVEYPNDELGNVVFWEKMKESLKI